MLVFGHTGITLGAAVVLANVLTRRCIPNGIEDETAVSTPADSNVQESAASKRTSLLSRLAERIDLRLLFVGSLLPDIVDKPVGQFFFRGVFSNGRVLSHTLLFLIIVTLAGLWFHRRYAKNWLLVLAFGILTHLICDQMWRSPRTLLWPIYGFSFERMDLTHWVSNLLYALQTNAQVYVPELVGLVILVWFAAELVRRGEVIAFIKTGRV
jgi:inner membrane protein